MAKKILGKAKPAAATDTVLYTVPTGKSTLANVYVCNQSGTADTVRVAVVLAAGAVNWNTDSIFHDVTIERDSPAHIPGFALADDEDIVVRSTNGTVSFVAMGLEV